MFMSYKKYGGNEKFSKQQMYFIDKQEKAKEKSKVTEFKVPKAIRCEKCKIDLSQDIDVMEPEEFNEPIYCDLCALQLVGEEND